MKNNQKKGNNNNKKNDQPKDDTKKKKFKKKPKWMFEKPKKADLHKAKDWNGSNWHWCGVDTGGHCEDYKFTLETRAKEKFSTQGQREEMTMIQRKWMMIRNQARKQL